MNIAVKNRINLITNYTDRIFCFKTLENFSTILFSLREFTSEYRGTKALTVGTKTINFIKLQDLTFGMLEPCIIDLKIGRRTWDPLATAQKRETEDGKYKQCKETVGFCIPGFQVYQLSSGTYKKYGREYGKKLNQNTVKDGKKLKIQAKIV